MPSESTSQVPSRSAAQFAIPAAGNLPQLKVLSKFFLGCPCPLPPLPLPRCGSSHLDLSPLPCTLSLGGFCGFRVPMKRRVLQVELSKELGFAELNCWRSWGCSGIDRRGIKISGDSNNNHSLDCDHSFTYSLGELFPSFQVSWTFYGVRERRGDLQNLKCLNELVCSLSLPSTLFLF